MKVNHRDNSYFVRGKSFANAPKELYAVMQENGYILAIVYDEDLAKRLAWSFNSYADIARKAKERDSDDFLNDYHTRKIEYIADWKFAINKDLLDLDSKCVVKKVTPLDMPVKLLNGFMDGFAKTKYSKEKSAKQKSLAE